MTVFMRLSERRRKRSLRNGEKRKERRKKFIGATVASNSKVPLNSHIARNRCLCWCKRTKHFH